jgi:hypothetical protein
MELSKEDETLIQTIRCHLERNEKTGKIEWTADSNGAWNVVKIDHADPARRLTFFMPTLQPGIDPYGQTNDPLGIIHIRKRNTGQKAAIERLMTKYPLIPPFFDPVYDTAKYYGAQIIKEKRLLQFARWKTSLFRRILLFFTPKSKK